MARYRLRHLLQATAILTQFPPFTWLYRAMYRLALVVGLRCLRRRPGVLSIYLRRGLAMDRAYYGLSDLDLLVIVADEKDVPAMTAVRRTYERLSRVIPLFAPGELQLFDKAEFCRLYGRSMFWRNRFEQGRREWKLLHGEDVFDGLPPCTDAGLMSRQDLGPAWFYLLQSVMPQDDRPTFLRRYVLFKKMADWARASLLANGIDAGFSREEILARAAAQFPETAETLLGVRRWRSHLLAAGPLPTDELLRAYVVMAKAALQAGPDPTTTRRTMRILAAPPETVAQFLGEAAIREAQAAVEALEGVERATIVPRVSFDPVALVDQDPAGLAGATIDAFELVLVGRQLPSLAAIGRLNERIARLRPVLIPFFCDSQVALPLQPVRRWAHKDPRSTPEFFQCLASASPFAGPLHLAGEAVVERPLESADALGQRADTLLGQLARANLADMPAATFYRLIWESLRATCIANQSSSAVIDVPVTSSQVLDMAIANDPSQADALRRAHREYCDIATGPASQPALFTDWARRYALELRARSPILP